ncbi:hypothetical protein CW745_08770 [Psychromonas sp. psych-6C06]|uniref:PEP-CTERM sorting domain-containing protein n=1 Tax=Psychromonas sp. psych-6C06 TaxID=2058089 RepID=UPI000C34E0C8|nr:PEP-CTERM sorting domain-containing protein [Psychromonas sp. psych-6C06]PKF61420.1 hypothetical protein CW745_08770 [Psychromonas sp. psych-6C06]
MKNVFLKLVACATLLVASSSTFATTLDTIQGEIAFFGFAQADYNAAETALESVSFNPVTVAATTIDFQSVAIGSAATFNDIVINNSVPTVNGGAEFWAAGDFTFTLTNITHNDADKDGLLNDFIANGVLKSVSGLFADTSGMMKFSANQFGAPGEFIFAASAVPAPATIALLGLALVGFGAARRKKQA